MKHRNRICTVKEFDIGFEQWDWDYFSPSRVCVKFHDTQREGVIDIIDLVPMDEKSREELENELEKAKLEIEYLKQQNVDLRGMTDLLNRERKIDQ